MKILKKFHEICPPIGIEKADREKVDVKQMWKEENKIE
jgi:hypothetical protein